MLAQAGIKDVSLAYNPVGPNIRRAVEFVTRFPDVEFAVTADHPLPIAELGKAMEAAGKTVGVLLDLNVGQHRTGILPGEAAAKLYRQIATTRGLRPEGIHAYDGQVHQPSREEREAAVAAEWASGPSLSRQPACGKDFQCPASSPAERRAFLSTPGSTIRRSN